MTDHDVHALRETTKKLLCVNWPTRSYSTDRHSNSSFPRSSLRYAQMYLVSARQNGVWVILLAWGFGVAAALQPSSSFVHTQCAGHRPIYAPLIEHQLSRYRIGEPLTVEGVLELTGDRNSSKSQILVVNNVVFTRVAPYGNMQTYYVPLFRKLTGKAVLPDLMLASNFFDLPEDDIARRGGP